MDKTKIKQRCRKVYVITTNNRIFDYPVGKKTPAGQYQQVYVFREESQAQLVMNDQKRHAPLYYQSMEEWSAKREVVAFYLIPAKSIDKSD